MRSPEERSHDKEIVRRGSQIGHDRIANTPNVRESTELY